MLAYLRFLTLEDRGKKGKILRHKTRHHFGFKSVVDDLCCRFFSVLGSARHHRLFLFFHKRNVHQQIIHKIRNTYNCHGA